MSTAARTKAALSPATVRADPGFTGSANPAVLASRLRLHVGGEADEGRHTYREYNFFQLLLLSESRLPAGRRLGLDTLPAEERIRVLPDAALRFPASEISFFGVAAPRGAQEDQWHPPWKELRVTFGGLYGVQSPLPYHFLDDIARQAPGSDVLASFLDIFNHRLYLLHYQVWKKYRYPQQFEAGARDRISRCLLGLGGFALDGTQGKTSVPLAHLLAYIGPFSQRVRNAAGLRAIVCEYLGTQDVSVEQLVPRWVTIDDVRSLASQPRGGSLRLGDNVLLGRRVPDPTGQVRIVIGPVNVKRFFECLPGGIEFANLRALVRLYLGTHIEFDLRLKFRTEGLPQARLSQGGMRLGWTSFLAGPLPALATVTIRNCANLSESDSCRAVDEEPVTH